MKRRSISEASSAQLSSHSRQDLEVVFRLDKVRDRENSVTSNLASAATLEISSTDKNFGLPKLDEQYIVESG
jgi:hypothetical protein